MARKLGIFGGTFNPIHYGHLSAAEEIRDRLRLDKILFIPSNIPPHKSEADMPSAAHRVEMVRLAILNNPRFELSDMEVKRGGRSYTIDTITDLRRERPETEFYFITGIDSFMEIHTWKDWERLLTQSWFVVLSRPGYRFAELERLPFMKSQGVGLNALDRNEIDHLDVRSGEIAICLDRIPLYDISSTDIRKRIRDGRTVKYLLPDAVETYIIENRLYA